MGLAMNCHPNHTPLTAEDMVTLALDAGLVTAADVEAARGVHDKAGFFFSHFATLTRDLRFAMMCRGDLVQDSRQPAPIKVKPVAVLDTEMVAFLTRNLTTV
jgi:hypothetical protein